MPVALVAGTAGTVVTSRAVQVYNAITPTERGNWRILYFDANGIPREYTRTGFNNAANIALGAQTHCLIFCHGEYNSANGDRSTRLSRWDVDADHAVFSTDHYINWLTNIGLGVQTIVVAACHAGDVGTGGANPTPIQQLVAIPNRPIHAIGPNTTLMSLQGVNINWPQNTPTGWTLF